jgi:hypothetical protein
MQAPHSSFDAADDRARALSLNVLTDATTGLFLTEPGGVGVLGG